jgi:hypothetical protein
MNDLVVVLFVNKSIILLLCRYVLRCDLPNEIWAPERRMPSYAMFVIIALSTRREPRHEL